MWIIVKICQCVHECMFGKKCMKNIQNLWNLTGLHEMLCLAIISWSKLSFFLIVNYFFVFLLKCFIVEVEKVQKIGKIKKYLSIKLHMKYIALNRVSHKCWEHKGRMGEWGSSKSDGGGLSQYMEGLKWHF